MNSTWISKPQEIRSLFNPAFCGWIVYESVKAYQAEKGQGMPLPLVFLIPPIVFHKRTRERLPSRKNSNLRLWATENTSILVDFSIRARRMNKVAYLALSQMLLAKKLEIKRLKVEATGTLRGVNTLKSLSSEIDEIQKKSIFVGKWFASSGQVASIYTSLGVRP